jgi:methyl-accepting chemotaxis protein
MKFRRNAPPVLIAAIIAVITMLTVLSASLFDKTIDATEQSQFALMRSIWTFNLKGAEARALARAEMIADLPSVRKLFAAKDRAALLAETQAMFKVQREKHGVDQAQFHLPPAQSFLRLHSPDKFGDDLTKFRPMVLAIGQDHQIKKGVAIARSGPAIFGIVPIHDDTQNYVGSFEMGIDFGSVLDGLKAAYGFELALFVEEGPLKEFAQGVDPAVYVDENRLGKYLKFHSTNWALLRELVSSGDLAANTDGIQYNRDAQGVPYGVLLLPVRNTGGTTLGVIALARDFSGTRATAGRSKITQGASALFGIVLLAGAVLIVIRGFLVRPLSALNERFAALAAGDTETRGSKDERWCEELQSLADNHEALRAQSQRSDGQDT